MATNNRGGNRGGGGTSNRRNNNPEGRNQFSGLTGTARSNPIAAAAAVGGAVAAGVFLWSRRNSISDRIAGISDQIGEWREGSRSGDRLGSQGSVGDGSLARGRTQAEIAEEALTLKETGQAG